MIDGIRLSIIIPIYQQWELCSALIPMLLSQIADVKNAELIIVDNGSVLIPDLVFEDKFTLLLCDKQGSYAARNFGLSRAKGDLILFTDADCMPSVDWIQMVLTAYDCSDKKTLLAGNVIVRSEHKVPTTAELYDIAIGLPQQRYVSRGCAVTANLAIPRPVFDEVGVFDDERFSGGDADFCQRALQAGFNLTYVPEAVVYHPARKTWKEYTTKVRRMKGGQIRAGIFSRRLKFFLITLIPPVWRFWRVIKSEKLKPLQKLRVVVFQFCLWSVELIEMFALLLGKTPERR